MLCARDTPCYRKYSCEVIMNLTYPGKSPSCDIDLGGRWLNAASDTRRYGPDTTF